MKVKKERRLVQCNALLLQFPFNNALENTLKDYRTSLPGQKPENRKQTTFDVTLAHNIIIVAAATSSHHTFCPSSSKESLESKHENRLSSVASSHGPKYWACTLEAF